MKKVVKVVIEKSKDGLYSAYCPNFSLNDKYSFGGFGDSARECQEDFFESIANIKDICEQQGECTDKLDNLEFIFEHAY